MLLKLLKRAFTSRYNFSKGTFLHGVSLLTGGTIIAQGLGALSLPIITRLFTPGQFDVLALYIAIVNIVTIVACLRYDIAIPIPNRDKDGAALLTLSLLASFIVSGLISIPIIFGPERLFSFLRYPELISYLWIIPPTIFFASSYNALQYWTSRKKKFGLLARTNILRSSAAVSTQVSSGLLSASTFGLIGGYFLHSFIGVINLAKRAWIENRNLFNSKLILRMRKQAKAYRKFPIYSVPEALFSTASIQGPLILIALIAQEKEVAFLFLAMRVMGIPMGVVGTSISQVFLSEAPAKFRDGTLSEFTLKTMLVLLKVGGPILLIFGVSAPIFFPVVFGQEWSRAGWLVAWITPACILQFIFSPVSMVLHVLNQQKLMLILQTGGFILRMSTVIFVLKVYPNIAPEVYAASGALFYAICIATSWIVIKGLSDGLRPDQHP